MCLALLLAPLAAAEGSSDGSGAIGSTDVQGDLLFDAYNGAECGTLKVVLWNVDIYLAANAEQDWQNNTPTYWMELTGPGTFVMDNVTLGEYVLESFTNCMSADGESWGGWYSSGADDLLNLSANSSYVSFALEMWSDGDMDDFDLDDYATGQVEYALEIDTYEDWGLITIGMAMELDPVVLDLLDMNADGVTDDADITAFEEAVAMEIMDDEDDGPEFTLNGDDMYLSWVDVALVDTAAGDLWLEVWFDYGEVMLSLEDVNIIVFPDDVDEDWNGTDEADFEEWGTVRAEILGEDWKILEILTTGDVEFVANDDSTVYEAELVDDAEMGAVEVVFEVTGEVAEETDEYDEVD